MHFWGVPSRSGGPDFVAGQGNQAVLSPHAPREARLLFILVQIWLSSSGDFGGPDLGSIHADLSEALLLFVSIFFRDPQAAARVRRTMNAGWRIGRLLFHVPSYDERLPAETLPRA